MKMLVFQWFRCFVGSPPIWGLFLASCWLLAGLLLASCWLLAGLLLASSWPPCWPLGFLLASSFPTGISPEIRFFTGLPKLVNSLHKNTCVLMVSVFRGVPLDLGPLAGLFLASCWLPRQSILAEHPARAPPPEHPARAPRQTIPPEHPASRNPYRRFAQKNVRALALRASGGSRDVCLAARNKSPPSWLLASFPARASRQKIGFS